MITIVVNDKYFIRNNIRLKKINILKGLILTD